MSRSGSSRSRSFPFLNTDPVVDHPVRFQDLQGAPLTEGGTNFGALQKYYLNKGYSRKEAVKKANSRLKEFYDALEHSKMGKRRKRQRSISRRKKSRERKKSERREIIDRNREQFAYFGFRDCSPTPVGKICNPYTGINVLKSSPVGKAIIAANKKRTGASRSGTRAGPRAGPRSGTRR